MLDTYADSYSALYGEDDGDAPEVAAVSVASVGWVGGASVGGGAVTVASVGEV